MMDPYDRFELMINGQVVQTPVAIASMAGTVNATYALERKDHIGIACLGGYSIDAPTIDASRQLIEAGRKEFLYDDPIEALSHELSLLEGTHIIPFLNLRGSTPESYRTIAEALGTKAVYEIDAHCRQTPMLDIGCGEYLLTHPEQLTATIQALKETGVVVSVKIRAGVAPDDTELARTIWKAGADILHVDLMDFGYARLRQIRNSCPLLIIANNSITSFSAMKDLLQHGADLVSVARHSDNATLQALDKGVKEYADDTGWYNAPKQLCRGGDIRGLTFCCIPVKECPLQPMLKKIGLSKTDYFDFKEAAVKNTPLERGEHTCFGSLAWCCKSSTPCMFRNMALQQEGLSSQDYMRYKHRLADKIMKRVFDETG